MGPPLSKSLLKYDRIEAFKGESVCRNTHTQSNLKRAECESKAQWSKSEPCSALGKESASIAQGRGKSRGPSVTNN